MKLTRNHASGTLNATVTDCCTRYHVCAHVTVTPVRPKTFERDAEGGDVTVQAVEILSVDAALTYDRDETRRVWAPVSEPVDGWPPVLRDYCMDCLEMDESFCERARDAEGQR